METRRDNILLGAPNEQRLGLSRAVRVGPFIVVGGTAPVDDEGRTVSPGDVGAQTRRCFEIIGRALELAGSSFDDVVRTRLILTDITQYGAAVEVRREFVGHVQPVDTIMQVDRFVDPEWLIEVEVDAIAAESNTAE